MVELSDAHAQEDSIEAGDDAEFLAAIRCEEAAVGLCFLLISLIQRLNASNRLPRQARAGAGQQETAAAEGRRAVFVQRGPPGAVQRGCLLAGHAPN